ncbi:MAG: deoxynucleoside kinase [Oscillospiraceae bacterium]|nr:deoxynucleoside kinase [Oscillospiraceae bacterium]
MLIVFEGVDGCGKSTQYARYKSELTRRGTEYLPLSFPRYEEKSSALIKMYLGGELGGSPDAVNAFAASSFYAVDRYASFVSGWSEDYNAGRLIVTDRYTTSNAIHQGAKLAAEERADYFRWLKDYEFRKIGLPEPDLTLYFRISAELSAERISARGQKKDIHERDINYLKRCVQSADAAADYFGWRIIDASNTEEKVFQEVICKCPI